MNPSAPLRRCGLWARGRVAIMGLAVLHAAVGTGAVGAQEELTLPELEGLYRSAEAGYEQAFEVLALLTSQFDRASQDLAAAIENDDSEARNQAYAATLRISGERRQAQRRVEERAEELSLARARLLDAIAGELAEYLAVADTASDPVNQRELVTFISDTQNRIRELRSLEDPQVILEPLSPINAEPRDGPTELRAKATILEVTATQYEEQYEFYTQQLEDLRRDQNLLRRSGDFLADFTRFGDPTVPVRSRENRNIPPPDQTQPPPGADSLAVDGGFLTLEERIQSLELLQEEITERIQIIRVRAQSLRRLAGGEWAW